MLYILLYTYSLDQAKECAKCDQIAALNKNPDDFINLCLSITISFINACTMLLSINMIIGWGKYLLFIKLFTVHNNYLQ